MVRMSDFSFFMPQDGFWIIGDDESRAYSSAACGFVPIAAVPEGQSRRIASAAELIGVLTQAGIRQGVDLPAYAATRRLEIETGGVAWNGHIIDTDRESGQPKLLSEFIAIVAGVRTDPSVWKFKGGDFESLTNAQMSDVCLTARTFIGELFNKENEIKQRVSAGTLTTVGEIDAAFLEE